MSSAVGVGLGACRPSWPNSRSPTSPGLPAAAPAPPFLWPNSKSSAATGSLTTGVLGGAAAWVNSPKPPSRSAAPAADSLPPPPLRPKMSRLSSPPLAALAVAPLRFSRSASARLGDFRIGAAGSAEGLRAGRQGRWCLGSGEGDWLTRGSAEGARIVGSFWAWGREERGLRLLGIPYRVFGFVFFFYTRHF